MTSNDSESSVFTFMTCFHPSVHCSYPFHNLIMGQLQAVEDGIKQLPDLSPAPFFPLHPCAESETPHSPETSRWKKLRYSMVQPCQN